MRRKILVMPPNIDELPKPKEDLADNTMIMSSNKQSKQKSRKSKF